MFQLTSHTIIQFTSLIIYTILLSLVLYAKQIRLKKLFSIFLVAAAGTSLVSLLMNLQLSYEQSAFWKMLMLPFTTWSVVAYAHFMMAFLHQDAKKAYKLGYIWLAITFALLTFGYITDGLALLNSEMMTAFYGQVVYLLTLANELVAVTMGFFLLRSLKNAADPEERNRTAYLLAGLIFMILANILSNILRDTHYTLSHIGLTGNAVLITYALLRYRLLDIQIVMKKWMVYTGVTVCVTLAYLALLLSLSNVLRLLPPHLGIPATVVMVFLFACLFNWVKAALDKGADRLFYGGRYVHRQMLLNFASKMSNFINTKEIANALVGPLAKAVRAKQVSLLLPVNDHYATTFVARLTEDEQIVPVMLQRSSLLTRWLENTGTPLLREGLESNPNLRKLSPEDRSALEMSQMEILCPIISKHKLVGILALSKKQPHGHYTRDDIDLVAMLAKESAVAIENAQIYAHAKEKADTDELTGLRNHRYFQEHLNQEIEKSSLSGDDFSLLFIDLDLFKTYNDIYGHVLGDEILKEVGQLIKSSIRDTDIGARYGGDEFAAILLHISLEGAQAVAERIRWKLEHLMDNKGITVTCSIGIACWRIDGVQRGKIIQAADEALYRAKRAGGNRICLASETDATESARTETTLKPANDMAVENIVYALAATVDARDHYTYGHSQQVSKYATELAQAIGYSKEGIQRIRSAALLHDIGKLNLPDSILTKRGPLTDDEWDVIKHHPDLGVNILKYIVGLRGCIDAVLFHHERYDGKGYPRGLKEKDIPLDARIMAIADAYDAMMSERGYRERSLTEEEAILELERCAGTQFDPELVEVFVSLRKKSLVPDLGLDADLFNVPK
jgi:diguanylate cyclase (GGDEF)-like protein/putative nucleotidyltransferase with HDIG domain